MHAIAPALGLSAQQVPEFQAVSHIPETSGGARVVHLHQLYKGIPIFQAMLTVRYDPDGHLIDTVGETISVRDDLDVNPTLSNQDAALISARHVAASGATADQFDGSRKSPRDDLSVGSDLGDSERLTTLDADTFGALTEAKLVWFDRRERLFLAWEVDLTFPHRAAQYVALVDAHNGEILYCRSLISAVAAQGNVFRKGGEPRAMKAFPSHPGQPC